MVAPVVTITASIISMGQEDVFSLIIKSFVVLGSICTIDASFAATLPTEVFDNAKRLNKEGTLKIGKDNNSMKLIYKTLKKPESRKSYKIMLSSIVNLILNLWILIIQNFMVVIFNYFGAQLLLLIQMIGYI